MMSTGRALVVALAALFSLQLVLADSQPGSHALQFGDLSVAEHHLDYFMGKSGKTADEKARNVIPEPRRRERVVAQRDADLIHFEHLANHPDETKRDERPLREALEHRLYMDNAVSRISRLLLGDEKLANAVRPSHLPVVDDWDCLKAMVATFEATCRPLQQYGMKHTCAFANYCNAHIAPAKMGEVAKIICQQEDPLAAY